MAENEKRTVAVVRASVSYTPHCCPWCESEAKTINSQYGYFNGGWSRNIALECECGKHWEEQWTLTGVSVLNPAERFPEE